MAEIIKTGLLLVFCLALFPQNLAGQHLISPVGRTVLPEVENLHYLTQTSDGRYWATSEKGITRFDGSQGTLFPIRDPAREVQVSRYIQSPLLEANDGRLWLSSYGALHVFDPRKETFRTEQLRDDGQTISQDYYLLQIDTSEGVALLRAGNYLWNYELETGKYRKIAFPTDGVVFASMDSDTWAAVGYNHTLEIYRRPPGAATFEREAYELPNVLMSVAAGKGDTLWLGTRQGLARFVLNNGKSGFEYKLFGPGDPTRAVLNDGKGGIWFTARTSGVCRYNLRGKPTIDTFGLEQGLSGTDPRWLGLDRLGRIWLSHYGVGFDVITKVPQSFKHVRTGNEQIITDLHSPDGHDVLVGEHHGRIKRISGTDMSDPKVHFLPSHKEGEQHSVKLRFGSGGKQVWAGNQTQLGRYDVAKGEFKWYTRPQEALTDFYRSGDGMLIVLSQSGIQSVRPSGDSIQLQPLLPFPTSEGTRFTGLFGLTDSTFLVWDRGTEIWPCLVRDGAVSIRSRFPVSGTVNSALQWMDRVFLGTNSGLMEVLSDTIISVMNQDPSGNVPSIRAMIHDKRSDVLWMGTTNGLLRYNPTSSELVRFGSSEGLPDEEFLVADPVQLDDGTVWMATKSGIIRFHPDSLSISSEDLIPYISGLWVNDIVQTKELIGQNLKRVERGYQQNSLAFRLGMIGLLPAGEGMIEYQLLDYDLAPIRKARNEDIRYPQLPPGKYQLQLTAIDGRGERSGTETIDVVINPPFWATIWFRVAVLLFFALMVTLVYVLLLERERHKQAEIREREALVSAERDRIAGEVHDDLGGQLSSIMFLSEELLLTEAAPALGYELGRINELSQHSLHNIRDIIFALDNRRATLADLCEQVKTAGEEFFRDHHLAFFFNGQCTRGERPLNSRQKRNLFSIVREAWHNTIKHAHANKVTMDFDAGEHLLTITLADDGRGLPEDQPQTSTGGYGLDNIKTKAEAIGGTLTVESQTGEGTQITLRIPLT